MKIAVLGTGLMGTPISERLLSFGNQVIVYNRTEKKAEKLKDKGAILAKTAKEAIKEAVLTILFLSDIKAINAVLFSEDPGNLEGKTFIQMGTIAPIESLEVQKKIFNAGGEYLECPVLGSRKEAKEGKLIMLVGSSRERYDRWLEFLKNFGPDPKYIGDVGKAAAVKLALNLLIAGHAVNFSASLKIVKKNKVETNIFRDILKQSSLYAPMFDKKYERWVKEDFTDPNFPVKHMIKDVGLILDNEKNINLDTQFTEAVYNMFVKANEQGLGDLDYSAVYKAIENE